MKSIKQLIKAKIMYSGLEETSSIRAAIAEVRRQGWPYTPPDEGDLLYLFAKELGDKDALEVGFATGSTAAYISLGLERGGAQGKLISIDYAQDEFEREGEKLIQKLGYAEEHMLLEEDSAKCLPRLYSEGKRFGLIFLDGWKTFDYVLVDSFYAARMLLPGGHLVFDDAKMPAVQKVISLLKTYYLFEEMDPYKNVGGWSQRAWHVLTTRGIHPPFQVLRKKVDIKETPAGKHFDFWMPF